MQDVNVNTSWDLEKNTYQPLASEQYEMREKNNIHSLYHTRVYVTLGKGFCFSYKIICVCPSCVAQLDKELFPIFVPLLQPRYYHVKSCYHKKIFWH